MDKSRPVLNKPKSNGDNYTVEFQNGIVEVSPELVNQYYAAGAAAASFADGLRDKLQSEAGPNERVRIVQISAEIAHAARLEKVNNKLILKSSSNKDTQEITFSIKPILVVE